VEIKTEEGLCLVTARNHTGAEKEHRDPDYSAATYKFKQI